MALAQKAGASDATVGYLETDQRLATVATLARLAAALGCSAAYLAYGLDVVPPHGSPATCDDMSARLQAVRVEQGHTKASLARLADVTPGTVADIESGGQAKVSTVETLAQALGISPAWLAFNQGPQVLPPRRRGRPPAQSADPT